MWDSPSLLTALLITPGTLLLVRSRGDLRCDLGMITGDDAVVRIREFEN